MNVTDRLCCFTVALVCGTACAEMGVTVGEVVYAVGAVWWGFTGLVAAVGWDTIRRARGAGQ